MKKFISLTTNKMSTTENLIESNLEFSAEKLREISSCIINTYVKKLWENVIVLLNRDDIQEEMTAVAWQREYVMIVPFTEIGLCIDTPDELNKSQELAPIIADNASQNIPCEEKFLGFDIDKVNFHEPAGFSVELSW